MSARDDNALMAAIAGRMNRLDEIGVTWDRCNIGDSDANAFGWIARDDGRADFVELTFQWGDTTGLDGDTVRWLVEGASTSSAEHSRRLAELLRGNTDDHRDCERVEHVFAGLVNRRIELAEVPA